MHVVFYHSPKERCHDFAAHFVAGVREHGDTIETRSINGDIAKEQDCAVILGVKKRRLFKELEQRGTPMVYIDKGYTREWTHRRISTGATQPSHYLGKWGKPNDRRLKFGWNFKPWRKHQPNYGHILLALSSPGYHLYEGMPNPEEFAFATTEELRKYTQRPIIYRPKPNQPRNEVPGTILSPISDNIEQALEGAHCVIVTGSSVCLQAMMMGIPSLVLGDSIGLPISSVDLQNIEYPYLAMPNQREQWLNDLAYCQWSLDEYQNGSAWEHVRPWY